jgi:RTA1 like protein
MSIQVIDNTPYYTTPGGVVYAAGGDNSNCTISVCPVELSVYGYQPSVPFSALMIALYGLCLIVQSVLGWRYKAWGFAAAMVLGCIDEIIGYAGRILYHDNPWGQAGFIIQIGMCCALRS